MGRNARCLSNQGAVTLGRDIADALQAGANQLQHPMPGQSGPLVAGVRKQSTDVTEGHRAQQGVAKGMDQHIPIGMRD